MNLKAKNMVETNRYELEIVIDEQELASAVNKAYAKNVKKINLPGFRRGKAPRVMIEKMYGADFFYEDALNLLYPDAVDFAAKEADIEIVSDKIDFNLVSMDKTGVDFKLTVTVKPEVELKNYKGYTAEKASVNVTEDEIDEQIKNIAERNSRMLTVEDRAAAMDDTAVIDFEGFIDDAAFEGGKGEGYSLKIGSGSFIPGFEEQVVGHNTGDEFDVNVTFPEDYHEEKYAGKPAVFKVKLHEIKEIELPNIDDEFVKDISEFDTIEEYKADLKAKAIEHKQKSADDDVENQLINQLIENLVAEIPSEMVDRRIDDNIRDFSYRLQMQGMDIDTYLKYTGADINAFRDSFREQADRQVKVRLALEKVAELENLEPTEDEINAELENYAKNYNMEIEKIKAAIPVSEIKKDLSVTKAVDFIRNSANITEVNEAAPAKKKPAAKKTTKKATETAETAE